MKNDKRVYIILQTSNIGGAEKRFMELWCYFKKQGIDNIFLVINKALFDIAIRIESLYLLKENKNNIIILDNKSKRAREFFFQFFPIIYSAPKGTIFHYPLLGIPFVHFFLKQKMIISMVNSIYFESTMNKKSKLLFKINSLFSDKIDILNPKVFYKIRKMSFQKEKLFLTVGSMVNQTNILIEDRKNRIVFQGRFMINDLKNVIKYARMLPFIHKFLLSYGLEDIEYYILGHGELETELRTILQQIEYKDINIKCYFEHNPLDILKDAKVILSLQKFENYPSRSLIEAMSLGVIPIITDVGESQLFQNREIIKYIDKDFTENEISIAILEILKLSKDEYYKYSLILKDFVYKNHSIIKHSEYYLNLYGLTNE